MNNFQFDPTSTLPPDGVSVICPLECSSIHTEVISGNTYVQLTQCDIFLGSMLFRCLNPPTNQWSYNLTDLRLHGHSWTAHHPSPNNSPLMNHAAGRVKLPIPGLNYEVTYRYAASPGRWIREWSSDAPVTPAMLGATGTGDEYNLLAWTFNRADELGRAVYIDREYRYSGCLTLPHNTRLYGRGPYVPGLTMDSGAAFERFRKDQGYYDSAWCAPTELDSWLGCYPTCITHKPDAKYVSIENLQINGNQAEVDWAGLQEPKFNPNIIDNALMNSPAFAGLSFSNHAGREVDGLEVSLRNVHVHDTPGSCLLGHQDVRVSGNRIVAGNSVGGRVDYALCGTFTDVDYYGFTDHSILRSIGPKIVTGLRYRGRGFVNPWGYTSTQVTCMELAINNTVQDAYSGRRTAPVQITGLDVDLAGTPFTTGILLGGECVIDGYIRNSDPASPLFRALQTHDRVRGSNPSARINLRTVNSQPINLSHPSGNASSGNWVDLVLSHTNERDAAHRLLNDVDPSPVMRARRTDFHSPHAIQTATKTLVYGWPVQSLLHVPDVVATPADQMIPTVVTLKDCRLDNVYTNLIGTRPGVTEEAPDNLASKPFRVRIVNSLFNWPKPANGIGSATNYYNLLPILSLTHCRAPDGLVSEESGVAIVPSGQQSVDVQTSLMWTPRAVAVTAGASVEWITIDPGTRFEDARRPVLRITLSHLATENVFVNWSAQVAP